MEAALRSIGCRDPRPRCARAPQSARGGPLIRDSPRALTSSFSLRALLISLRGCRPEENSRPSDKGFSDGARYLPCPTVRTKLRTFNEVLNVLQVVCVESVPLMIARLATVVTQVRIRLGSRYLTGKAANWDLISPNALSSAERAAVCSFDSFFAALVAPEKTPFRSGERRTSCFACSVFNQLCTRSVPSAERSMRSFNTACNFDIAC